MSDHSAAEDGWQQTIPPLDRIVAFETPTGEKGHGRLMRMQSGRYALQTPHEGFTGSETFFEVARWRPTG
ncbi:MAG: hypothetical protein INR68_07845 [Methylobacterium mesophilicum]|nr:hypothetical protein [Methylobacterium mesophilicum]